MSQSSATLRQKGFISPLILIGVISVLVLFVIFGTFPIKDKLFGGLFGQKSSHAAGAVDLSLVPNQISVAKNQTFLVDVAIDAKTDQPSAMFLGINYDPAVLQATNVQQGFFFTEDLDPTAPKIANGKIQMTLGQKPNQYKTGNGIVATIEFKALQATSPTTAVSFDTTYTQIAAINKTGNQVGSSNGSVVTVTNTTAVTKTADFDMNAPSDAQAGQTFTVPLLVKTTEDANLFAARINFNPALLQVQSISTAGSFITQWVNDNNFDNTTGQISLIGGVPNPGYHNSVLTNMATITFKAKSAGAALIAFGANSAIYRNVDNVDILKTPSSDTVTITGVAPSASPSVAPSVAPSTAPSTAPSASPSVAPSSAASAAPSASPSSAASASPAVSPSPVASPSSAPQACAISQATWITSANPVDQGKVVGLSVTGTGNCVGQNVSFVVREDDGLLGNDPVKNNPPSTKFNSNNIATSSWLAEFQEDGLAGVGNPPEYFFLAQLATGAEFKSANPVLQVNKLGNGVSLTGDVNKDGVVDLVDLSMLLSNWNKTADFIDELDLNSDGVVNSVDWGTMILILRTTGVIK